MLTTNNDVVIDENKPFKNCKFERQENADILENVLKYTKDNVVINLTAPWGYGKTTFLKMFAQQLSNHKKTCIYFSAWEHDYVEDPFSALIGYLTNELKKKDEYIEDKSKVIKLFNAALPVVGNIGLKMLTANMLNTDTLKDIFSESTDTDITNAIGSATKKILTNYTNTFDHIIKFKKELELFAKEQPTGELIIIIDELDRCRPNFAIEMLERVKHIMSVPKVKFILGTDKKQLAESIKVLYGSNFDSIMYLDRFIDFEFELNIPRYSAFVDVLISEYKIDEIMETFNKEYNKKYLKEFVLFLSNYLKIDLRTLRQLFFKLHLSIISLTTTYPNNAKYVCIDYLFYLIVAKKNNSIIEILTPSVMTQHYRENHSLIRIFGLVKFYEGPLESKKCVTDYSTYKYECYQQEVFHFLSRLVKEEELQISKNDMDKLIASGNNFNIN